MNDEKAMKGVGNIPGNRKTLEYADKPRKIDIEKIRP